MKKNFLFVMDGLKVGGVESALISVLHRIDYEQYDVDLLLLHNQLDLIDQLPGSVKILNYEQSGVSGKSFQFIVIYSAFKFTRILGMKSLSQQLAKSMQRSLHCTKIRKLLHKNYAAVIGYKQGETEDFVANCIQHPNKTVFYHHGSLQDEALHQQTFGRVQHIAAVSDGVCEMLRDRYPEYADRMVVIPNYIEPERIFQRSKAYPVKKQQEKYCICTVGRLAREKRYDLVLEAARILRDRYSLSFRWYMIGDGDQMESLQLQIAEYGLEEVAVLTGQLKNPLPYVAACDVYVQTSEMESYGLAMQEALVLGKPVVTTPTIGGKMLVKEGMNGFVVEHSPESIVHAILSTIDFRTESTKANYYDLCITEDAKTDRALQEILV